MRVLIVCSHNSGRISPFVEEQVNSLIKSGIDVRYFLIKGQGFTGYLRSLSVLKGEINTFKPELIHAHYGLSGLLANLQRSIPVVTTFHGSDVNKRSLRMFSWIAMMMSAHGIFVSVELSGSMRLKRKWSVIPCSVDTDLFKPFDKAASRKKMNYNAAQKLILFSASASNKVKNYPLAKAATGMLKNAQLIELDGYSRDQVCTLINCCDVALMTSFTEGSPQFIKEAMACSCPVVTTNAGNVKWLLGNTEGCYISSFEPADVAQKLNEALRFSEDNGRTNGRERIFALGLDPVSTAEKIINVYNSVV